jgi:urea transporter
LAGFFHSLRRFARVSLVSYAQVLLSSNPLAGLFFLAASFATYPKVGLAGLLATVAANLVGWRTCPERIRWELGLSGYNAVMLGLAIGYFLPHQWWAYLLVVAGGGASAILTGAANLGLGKRSLPVLGLPFLGLGWVVLGGAALFTIPAGKVAVEFLNLPLGGFAADFIHYLGSVYFSGTYLSGLLVLAGLLIASRLSAAIGLAGALAGALLSRWHPTSLAMNINLIIAPVGVAFFLAPSRRLPLYVLLGLVLTALFGLGLEPLFKAARLSVLILPLTLTLFSFLALGRKKLLGVELVPLRLLHSPESNVSIYRTRLKESPRLPFFGTWFVSQGVRGGETHQGRLAHAWDFMVRDERGRTFAVPGYRLPDYHAFGLLVTAPESGRVVSVENGVPDNPPGKLNRAQNWGNYVVIEHSPFEYSILAHLQQGSVRVKPGDRVEAGTVLAGCGNSGYSAQPHLHYQLQVGPAPGSDALPCRFRNYSVIIPGRETFVRSGVPEQNETIQPLAGQEPTRRLLKDSVGHGLTLELADGRRCRIASFESGSSIVLRSGPTRVRLQVQPEGMLVNRISGPGATLLARLFTGLDYLPFCTRPGFGWQSGDWRHRFDLRERLDPGVDALILESTNSRVRRRIWFGSGIGIARVEWKDGAKVITARNVRLGQA